MDIFCKIISIMACIYLVARLLLYACLRLEDDNKHPKIQMALISICFILWILSLPFTIVFGATNKLHENRIHDKFQRDYSKDPQSVRPRESSIPAEIISILLLVVAVTAFIGNIRLENEVEELNAQIEAHSSEYDTGYDAGREAAWDEAYYEGYNEGSSDGYNEGYEAGKEETYAIAYEDGYLYGVETASGYFYDHGYEYGYDAGYNDAISESTNLGISEG